MASNLVFYLAWVSQTDKAYSPSFARHDENVFGFTLEHDEGQIPKLTIQVVNPRIGLIAPGRPYWAWLSYSPDGGTTLVPLFFGRLVGIPTSILANVIEMQFVARPADYIQQKQNVAESLKSLPNYDPIFFDSAKRDDPDAILEGWSRLYHVGRTDSTVSASDVLIGEDGEIGFGAADVFYDSVKMKLLQSPLQAINVKAEVAWEQQWRGRFFVGQWSFPTLGGEAFTQDWPKSGASLGGGYWAGMAYAGESDPSIQQQYLMNWTGNASVDYKWTNTARKHATGDTMSTSTHVEYPITDQGIPFQYVTVKEIHQGGVIAPDATDAGGNPAPTNTPAYTEVDQFAYRQFDLTGLGKTAKGVLDIVYQANRKRSERIDLTVQAAVQPILLDPLITEDTETITLKSGDLSLPLINLLNWSGVAGQPVALGQLIFPDNPLVPGQTSTQICVTAGTAGTVEPVFSNVSGVTTSDGSVVWSSCGATTPPEMAQDWQRVAPVPLGATMIPKPVMGVPDKNSITAPGAMNYPPMGVPITLYTILSQSGDAMPGSTLMECTQGGILGGFSIAPATFNTFTNPSGQSLFICVSAGTTGTFHTTFNETPGAETTDGSVIWRCVGPVILPIGGVPGLVAARSYFPSDRGQLSLQHLICRARAKLRRRARAVQVSFDARFEAAANAAISCRMNASMIDARLPGGGAGGKVIAYKLTADGDSGKVIANVTLGCAIGEAGALGGLTTGTESYVTAGYVQPAYQQMDGVVKGFAAGEDPDIGYAPPVEQPVDDGLAFPLNGFGDAILSSQWHGVASTMNAGNIELYNSQLQFAIQDAVWQAAHGAFSFSSSDFAESVSIPAVDWGAINFAMQQAVTQSIYQGTSLWYELVMKTLTGGPYAAAYVVGATPLIIPKTIDLSAPSSGG